MKWFMRFRLRLQRLNSSIQSYREEFTSIMMKTDEDTRTSWENLLKMAEEALTINEGYHFFKSAYRLGLKALDQNQLEAEARSLHNEAEEKLSSWRKKTVSELITHPVKMENLAEARKILDEHFDNRYFTNDLIKRQIFCWFFYFTVVLLAIFFLILFGFPNSRLPLGKIEQHASINMLLLIFLFGALGGTIFSFLSTTQKSASARIIDQLLTWYVTLIRPLWGGVGALVVYLGLQAGIFQVNLEHEGALVLSISIAAGYAERLATGALENVATLISKNKAKANTGK
ncbi:MAG TPA: hypothetical protein DCY27_05710 [Desulfobacterales bacterium]|nr:hypothetical protein [Desulfobacterales bacterium]